LVRFWITYLFVLSWIIDKNIKFTFNSELCHIKTKTEINQNLSRIIFQYLSFKGRFFKSHRNFLLLWKPKILSDNILNFNIIYITYVNIIAIEYFSKRFYNHLKKVNNTFCYLSIKIINIDVSAIKKISLNCWHYKFHKISYYTILKRWLLPSLHFIKQKFVKNLE